MHPPFPVDADKVVVHRTVAYGQPYVGAAPVWLVVQRERLCDAWFVEQKELLWLPSAALQHEWEAVLWPYEPAEGWFLARRPRVRREPLRELLRAVHKAVVERLPLHQDLLVAEPRRLLLQQLRVSLLQLWLPQYLRVEDPLLLEAGVR